MNVFPPEMSNTTADATAAMTEASQKVEAFAHDTSKTMTEQFDKLTRGFETATAFNKDTMDAMVKSSEIASKAVEGINAEFVGFSKRSFEHGVAAAKDFASARNVSELFQKQADFARSAMDSFVSHSTKLNEMMMSATKSAVEPIGARFSAATEVFKGFTA